MGKTKLGVFFRQYWPYLLIGVLSLFLFTYNLGKNSRFIWDESRALVDMHRIWELKQITFVGPISEDRLEMFPSLSYYLYLPATVLTNFDPLGPAYMAAFFGVLAWLFLTITVIKNIGKNQKSIFLSLLIAVLYPIVVTSRWAWNPNPVIFWISLFVLSLFSGKRLLLFLGGLALGASLYHHYLAALGVAPTMLLLPLIFSAKKDLKKKLPFTLGGILFSIIPFALFELKNHFFLNFGTFSSANEKSFITLDSFGFFSRLWNSLYIFASTFVPQNNIFVILFLVIFIFIFFFYRKDKYIRYTFFVILLSTLLFSIVKTTYPHYQYVQVPLAVLFIVRFISQNKNIVGTLLLLALLGLNLNRTVSYINSFTWQGDISAVRNVSKIILEEKKSKVNVAALQSDDTNLTGQRYRDMVLIGGKTLDAFDKYPESEVLYIVSRAKDENTLRQDQAWEIQSFRGSKITDKWKVSELPSYLYRFEK